MKIVVELEEKQTELLKRISDKLGVDYEMKGNQIPCDSLFYMIEDLNIELDEQEEKYKNLVEDINDNYRPITPKEMYD
jgi:hypothetical protein